MLEHYFKAIILWPAAELGSNTNTIHHLFFNYYPNFCKKTFYCIVIQLEQIEKWSALSL
jgi:hypothetical protein